jgi:hypothetical protein
MFRPSTFLLVALTVACSGCFVVSLHPLASKETSLRDERIIGTWQQSVPTAADTQTVWTISKHPQEVGVFASLLKVQIVSGDKVWTHSGRLAKLGESLYLDLVFGDGADDSLTLHPHQFLRLRFADKRAFIELCDMKKVEKVLKEKPTALTAEQIEGKLVLTSKTPELQAFFREFGDRVVSEPIVLERK